MLRESCAELDWAPDRMDLVGEAHVDFDGWSVDHTVFACVFPGFDAIEIEEGDGAELVTVAEARARRTFAEPVLDPIERYLRER